MPCGIFQWYLRVLYLYLLLVFGISSAISFNKGGWLIADVFDDDVQPFISSNFFGYSFNERGGDSILP